MNRAKLRNILKAITPEATNVDFSSFDNELTKLKEKLKEKVVVKTLEDVNVALEQNRKRINFEPLTKEFEKLKSSINVSHVNLLNTLNSKQSELANLIKENDNKNSEQINELIVEVAILQAKKTKLPDFSKQIKESETKLLSAIDTAKVMDALVDEKEKEKIQSQFATFEKQFKELKLQLQQRGGGSMNRKINFNGTNYLTRYTDINYKAGSNVTFTIANNDQTKQVDVTIASSGGGGGNSFAINELPSGTIDDSNLTFTLAHSPVAGTVAVYVNRLRLDPNLAAGAEYSISGTTLTLTNAVGAAGSILVDYQY